MKRIILVVVVIVSLLAISLPFLYGQNGNISGVVVDSQGNPIIGAAIMEKGHPGNSATSGLEGDFTMRVSARQYTLKASYIGYKNYEGDFQSMYVRIVLEEDNE